MQLLKFALLPLAAAVAITGCSNSSNNKNDTAQFTVQVTNLTYSQPFSPSAIILHRKGYQPFTDGEPASVALERLTEGGDPEALLTEAEQASQWRASIRGGAVGQRAIGASQTITLNNSNVADLRLSLVTMLVDTNDAFTGVNAENISGLAVGQSRTFVAPSWDSGTEANTETAATMPGPAAQAVAGAAAEGFNAARDDLVNRVHFHPGVVTSANADDASAEGLASSALREGDRWDNPTARITITRVR